MQHCLNCQKETTNPKFCSQSCSISYSNRHRPKKPYYCSKCNQLLGYGYSQFHRRKYCEKCTPNYVDWMAVTYKEMISRYDYQVNARIRELARKIYQKTNKPKCCANCGYNKHYEVCHIKGISDHDLDTTIGEINDIHNLIALCPNCHWEMDNGLLECKEEWK